MKRVIGMAMAAMLMATGIASAEDGDQATTTTAAILRILQDNAVTQLLDDASARHRPRSAAFVDVSLVLVRDGTIREHQTVVVENGRFTAIGDLRDVRIPRGAAQIDGAGKFLLPGLTDMHVHSMVSNSQKLLNLANGVTTVREMDGFPYLLEERRALRENRLLGPTMYVTGTILAAVPMEDYARVVTSPEEARAAVVEQKRAGYDFIKVHNVLPDELYRAVLDEARRQSMDVVGHIPHVIRIEDAIRLGQRTFEHMKGYYSDRTLALSTEDYVGLTKGASVWNCPTLYTRRSGIARPELERLIATSAEMRYVPASEKRRWLAESKDVPDTIQETVYEHSARVFKELLAVRGRFLTGTDSGGGYRNHVPGFALQHELETMESLGMPAAEVLRSSTVEAASAMRREREFGSIEVGMRADCILASKNPLVTVANLAAEKGVMVRGIWLPPEAIAEMLASLAAVYEDEARLVGASGPKTLRTAVEGVRRIDKAGSAARVGRESTLVSLGDLLREAGMAREAIDVLKAAVRIFPESSAAQASLAEAFVARGNLRAARDAVERALALDSGSRRARRLAEGASLRTPPSFDPAGVLALETRMYSKGAMKPVRFRLEVTGKDGQYTGRMVSDASTEFSLEDISAAGDRLWITAVSGQARMELRFVVSGRAVTGHWAGDFGGGPISGTRGGAIAPP